MLTSPQSSRVPLRLLQILLFATIAILSLALPAFAVNVIDVRDIVVVDQGAKSLVLVRRNNGDRTTFSKADPSGKFGSGPAFQTPTGIIFSLDGATIYVADAGLNAIVAVDRFTGNRTIFSAAGVAAAGPPLSAPWDLTVDTNGANLLVTCPGDKSLMRVALADGTRTVVSSGTVGSGTAMLDPRGVTVLSTGVMVVADPGLATIFAIAPDGSRSVLSDNNSLPPTTFYTTPIALEARSNGNLWVMDVGSGTLFEVDPSNGQRYLTSGGGVGFGVNFVEPKGISLSPAASPQVMAVADLGCNCVLTTRIAGGQRDLFSGTIFSTTLGTGDPFTALGGGIAVAPIGPAIDFDFGDLPVTYGTRLAEDGARHVIDGLFMGAGVTADGDGALAPLSDADVDDGVTFPAGINPLLTETVTIVSSGIGKIDAWIDYDSDGSFDEPRDRILTAAPVVAGSNALTFTPPGPLTAGPRYARVRLTANGAASSKGCEQGGEVSDFVVQIAPPTLDLAISVTSSGTSVLPGGTIAHTIKWSNAGNATTASSTVHVDIPAVATVDAAATAPEFICQPAVGGGLFCDLSAGVLAPGAQGSAVLALKVAAGIPAGIHDLVVPAQISGISGALAESTPADNAISITTAIDAAPDLRITAGDGAVTAVPGQTITYTLNIFQEGKQAATGVTALVLVPASTVFVATGSSPGWSCADGSGAATACLIEIGPMAIGAQVTRTFKAKVLAGVAAGVASTSLQASAADDSANGPDPTPLNNTAVEATPIDAAPDLFITALDGGAPAKAGQAIDYSIEYWNFGNQGAANVSILVQVPAHTTVDLAQSTAGFVCTPGAGGVSCSFALGSVPADSGSALTLSVDVAATLPAGVAGTTLVATIEDDGANGADPKPADNTSELVTTFDAAPDLVITLNSGGASVTPGAPFSTTVGWRNDGTQNAAGVALTVVLPSGSTFQAAASSPLWQCAGTLCGITVGALPAGASSSANIVITLPAKLAAGIHDIKVSAAIIDDGLNGDDEGPGNEDAELISLVDAAPDLVLMLPAGQAAVPGDVVAWTFTWLNSGNQTAANSKIEAVLPVAASFNATASTPGWSCAGSAPGSVCTFTLGPVGAGTTNTNTFALKLNPSVPAGLDSISVPVSFTDDGANGPDPHPTDNSGPLDVVLVALPDLAVTIEDGGLSIKAGQSFSWAIQISNHGTRDATGVELNLNVPTGATFNSAQSDAAISCGPGTAGAACVATFANLMVGSPKQVVFTADYPAAIPKGLESVKVVVAVADDLSNGVEPSLIDNLKQITTPVDAAPDLHVTIDDNAAVAEIGQPVEYVVAYGNQGDQDSANWAVHVLVPLNTVFLPGQSASFVCVPDNGPGSVCTLGGASLAAGSSDDVNFVVEVADPLLGGAVGLSVSASIEDDGAGGVDPTQADRASQDTTPIDTHPVVSVASASAPEDGGPATLVLSLSLPTGLPVVVPWQTTTTGTATVVDDFAAVSSSATFAPGSSSVELTIVVVDDALDEADETVVIELSGPTGATLGTSTGTLTIEDDDVAPGIGISDAMANEEDGTLVFDVTLDAPSGLDVSVAWQTVDGTALAGPDYLAASGTLEIAAGDTVGQISVTLLDDTVDEDDDETFTVELSAAVNVGAMLKGVGTGTIHDDDEPPPVSVADLTVSEAAGVAVVTISLSHSSGLPVTVDYATSDGTASSPADYTAKTGTVVIPAKTKVTTVEIAIVDDDLDESATAETFTFTLTAVDNGVLADAEAVVSITDDDATPVGEPDDFTLDEDAVLDALAPGVLVNDGDADGGTLSAAVASAPAVGTLALAANGGFTWTPPSNFNGPASFTYTVSDGTNTSAPVLVSIGVNAVNDAPVLSSAATLTLTAVAEDATDPPGDTVAAILASGGAAVVTDVDGDTEPGVAVTAVDAANGAWEWSTGDGAAWSPLTGVSETAALLLNGSARVRFVPAADFDGEASLTLRAWDRSAGASGDVAADASVNGGTSAFSTQSLAATVQVVPTNDPPVFIAPTPDGPLAATEGQVLAFQLAVADPDGPAPVFSVSPLPPGATLDAATGDFAWTPAWTDAGPHTLLLGATDGVNAIQREVQVEVTVIDDDADGVPDGLEAEVGLLSDTADSDGDTISDADEIGDFLDPTDTDEDSVIDALDTDSDDDGILDADEAGDDDLTTPPVDTDEDGTPDYRDTDSDDDGVEDAIDVCRLIEDPDQADLDEDGEGDLCDDDIDGDGLPNALEEALGLSPTNPDTDGDGIPDGEEVGDPDNPKDSDDDGIIDANDDDSDNDGIPDSVEVGDDDPGTPPVDTDKDGIPDYLDDDSDNDGVPDAVDLCRLVTGSGPDSDEDGQGDPCDDDDDGDGADDATDNCPGVANADQADADDDGAGDVCDDDDDNDGVPDATDGCPNLADAAQLDTDKDGMGDACDPDDDGDGVDDAADNCPLVANADQADSDTDGIGDACDTETPPVIVDGDVKLGGGCASSTSSPDLAALLALLLMLGLWQRRRRSTETAERA
ncbi:MAG: Calx-beta domain-containing protein [Myxococcota bacterium]